MSAAACGGRRDHSPTPRSSSAVCAVMTALAMTPALRGLGPPGAAVLVLTVATATVTAGAAILAEVAEPGLRRSALVVGGGGVRPLRGGGAARQRARGGRRHASPAADPRGRVRRGAAAARVVAAPAAPRCRRLCAWVLTVVGALLATAASLVPESAVPTRSLVAVLVVAVLPAWTAVARRLRRRRATGAAAGRGCGSGSVSRWWRSPSCTGRRPARRSATRCSPRCGWSAR